MPASDIPPPADVLAVVLGAWALGTAVFAAWTHTFGVVQAGHFKVVWPVTAGLAVACALAATAGGLTVASAVRTIPFALGVAASLGAVTNAMLLGHWHLNQPRLGTEPIRRLVYALWASLVLYVGANVALTLGASDGAGVVLLGSVTAIAFTVFSGVLTAMVTHLVRTRSIMSATGILYLEVLLLFVAAFTGSLGALAR